MKILITESQFKVINELRGAYKEETEIIYRDNNIVAMIPKSQMTSRMFGKGTSWCQVGKTGFDMWSDVGLLIRFLMRGGRKVRFTYFFKDMGHNHEVGKYYWANESGHHVLYGEGDPFDPKPKRVDRSSTIEQDIIGLISKIPEEAKEKVREFITIHKDGYDYCYRNEEFKTKKEVLSRNNVKELRRINDGLKSSLIDMFGSVKYDMDVWYSKEEFNINYSVRDLFDYFPEDEIMETFLKFDDAKKFVLEMSKKIYQAHVDINKKRLQPKSNFK